MRTRGVALHVAALCVCAAVAVAARARAAGVTDVASAFDPDNAFDLRLQVGYAHDEDRASVKREQENAGQDEVAVFRDLLYTHRRDSMHVRAEAALFHDLSVSVDLPFVLSDQRSLGFDQSLGTGCILPGMQGTPTCVNAQNSSTVTDGIAPATGYDAQASTADKTVGFPSGSNQLFQGPKRGGSGLDALDTINLAIQWNPMSQRRDPTKPTWLLGFEGQVSFGNVMKFDRAHPDGNHGVSEGLHKLIFRTAVSKRWTYVEPYMGLWYLLPIARDDSLFVNYGAAQRNQQPQHQGGAMFGLEGVPYERPKQDVKVAIDVRGRLEGHFGGRGYSEAWELFASSPALACDGKSGNPACDPTMMPNPNTRYQGMPYTGLTLIQNYATVGADLALVVQAGRYLRVTAGLNYSHDQSHLITADDVGTSFDPKAGDGCSTPGTGRVARPCEYNPAYRPIVNQVGRRYLVDDLDHYRFFANAQAMF